MYPARGKRKIQNKAARIFTGATKLASIQFLLPYTGWESLTSGREKDTLVLFYKMGNSLAPEYLSSLVPPTVGNISKYDYILCNETNLQTIPARSQQYYNSFLPSTTRIWNSLQDDTKNSPSVESFKHKLNNNITKPPPFYTIRTNIPCPHTIELLTEVSYFPEKHH